MEGKASITSLFTLPYQNNRWQVLCSVLPPKLQNCRITVGCLPGGSVFRTLHFSKKSPLAIDGARRQKSVLDRCMRSWAKLHHRSRMSAEVKEPIAFQSLWYKCNVAVGLRHNHDSRHQVLSCIRLGAFKIYEYDMKVQCVLFPMDILKSWYAQTHVQGLLACHLNALGMSLDPCY